MTVLCRSATNEFWSNPWPFDVQVFINIESFLRCGMESQKEETRIRRNISGNICITRVYCNQFTWNPFSWYFVTSFLRLCPILSKDQINIIIIIIMTSSSSSSLFLSLCTVYIALDKIWFKKCYKIVNRLYIKEL